MIRDIKEMPSFSDDYGFLRRGEKEEEATCLEVRTSEYG
jgi:hypothetical protein